MTIKCDIQFTTTNATPPAPHCFFLIISLNSNCWMIFRENLRRNDREELVWIVSFFGFGFVLNMNCNWWIFNSIARRQFVWIRDNPLMERYKEQTTLDRPNKQSRPTLSCERLRKKKKEFSGHAAQATIVPWMVGRVGPLKKIRKSDITRKLGRSKKRSKNRWTQSDREGERERMRMCVTVPDGW